MDQGGREKFKKMPSNRYRYEDLAHTSLGGQILVKNLIFNPVLHLQ